MKRAGSGMAQSTLAELGEAVAAQRQTRCVSRPYVTGMALRSTGAIADIRKICAQHRVRRHELRIVDLDQHPLLAEAEEILAAPTLIRKWP